MTNVMVMANKLLLVVVKFMKENGLMINVTVMVELLKNQMKTQQQMEVTTPSLNSNNNVKKKLSKNVKNFSMLKMQKKLLL